jgi:very-long-chain enoyl-CoA reductase
MYIHLALRDLRPQGSTERKIPFPTSNLFTLLFDFVSCPNYTYEVTSWIAFAVMTQCTATVVFATLGFMQMAVWALGKHRNYRKEFSTYPRRRKAIIPFLL